MESTRNFSKIISYIFVGALVILIPDYALRFVTPAFKVIYDPRAIGIAVGLSVLAAVLGRIGRPVLITSIWAVQLCQLTYGKYFGVPIHPTILTSNAFNAGETLHGTFGLLPQLWLPITLVVVLWLLHLKLPRLLKVTLPRKEWGVLLLIPIILVIARHSHNRTLYQMMPNDHDHSIHNTMNTLAYALFSSQKIAIDPTQIYQPIVLKDAGTPRVQNIVLIFGESSNSRHFSVCGGKNPTTPFLDSLKARRDFMVKPAFSGGVSTGESQALFFNLMREPGNTTDLANGSRNLFKLARDKGFRTTWISEQEEKLLFPLKPQYLDIAKPMTQLVDPAAQTLGAYPRDFLKDLAPGQRNFIVLNLYAPHAPYAQHYQARGCFDKFGNPGDKNDCACTYDNAVLVMDQTLKVLVTQLEQALKPLGSYVILFVSDHGELVDHPTLRGHHHLLPETAETPFWALGNLEEAGVSSAFGALKYVTHHEVSTLIAQMMGIAVINPNIPSGPRQDFIHGNGVNSDYEFIRIKECADGKPEFCDKIMTSEWFKQQQQEKSVQ